jgi:transcriptional regulator GlxA family with amidase domain
MDYLFHTLLGNHHDRVGVRSLMPSSDTNDPHLKRVIEYMHDCYMQPISIDLLASLAGMSRFHFIRSFKLLTRFAPYQYMLAIRIDEAKQRLRSTRMTVTEISLDVGFSSPSQLYRAFHKFTGMSPEQYRQHS